MKPPNLAAKAVRSRRFRPKLVKSKKLYRRRPKHPPRAADAFWATVPTEPSGAGRVH